jgi:hypothetical protein
MVPHLSCALASETLYNNRVRIREITAIKAPELMTHPLIEVHEPIEYVAGVRFVNE